MSFTKLAPIERSAKRLESQRRNWRAPQRLKPLWLTEDISWTPVYKVYGSQFEGPPPPNLNLLGDPAKLLIALLACLLGYGEVGLWLKREAKRPNTWVQLEGNPYRSWIEDYSGELYQTAVKLGLGRTCFSISRRRHVSDHCAL